MTRIESQRIGTIKRSECSRSVPFSVSTALSFRIADASAKKPDGKRISFGEHERVFSSSLDWDETEPREIVDESASMPRGWLEFEQAMIADPDAVKPADW